MIPLDFADLALTQPHLSLQSPLWSLEQYLTYTRYLIGYMTRVKGHHTSAFSLKQLLKSELRFESKAAVIAGVAINIVVLSAEVTGPQLFSISSVTSTQSFSYCKMLTEAFWKDNANKYVRTGS